MAPVALDIGVEAFDHLVLHQPRRFDVRLSELLTAAAAPMLSFRTGVGRPFTLFVAILLVPLLIAEAGARLAARAGFGDFRVDAQTPLHLKPTIDQITDALGQGKTVVVMIGDSLWYGATMAAHGDRNWRSHTIDNALEDELNQAVSSDDQTGEGPFRVVNLGMNGLLPTEMLALSEQVKALGVQAVVTNIGLRSVSQDFEQPADFSRDWLRNLSLSANGDMTWGVEEERSDALHRLADGISHWFANHLLIASWRSQLRQHWFGGTPPTLTQSWARQWVAAETNGAASPEMVAQLQAKQRYSTARFDPTTSIQTRAFVETLQLAEPEFAVIAVYSTLNPARVRTIVRPTELTEHEQTLDRLAAANAGPNRGYVPKITDLTVDHYLDLVHVDREGYAIYARAIAPVVLEAMGEP